VQCGYCTPGMIMTAEYLLRKYRQPSIEQIRRGIAGNLCRCTGYRKIVSAIRKTARRRAARRGGE
ncbi:MAG: (2Fe-2S)-binding protein, partial [Deltaproteobacteria bacterium]